VVTRIYFAHNKADYEQALNCSKKVPKFIYEKFLWICQINNL